MTEPSDVDEFRKHPLWAAVDATKKDIDTAKARSSTDRHTLARGLATLAYLGEYRSLDSHLFPSKRQAQLVAVQQYVAQLAAQVQAWDQSAGMTASTVQQIDANSDAIMANISSYGWPALRKESRAAAIAEAADAFRVTSEASLAALQADVENAQADLKDVESGVEGLKAEAELRTAEAKSAAEAFQTSLTEQDVTSRDALSARVKSFDSAAAETRARYDSVAQEHLQALEVARIKAAELLAFVTDGTVAGGYSKFAEEEKWAYRFWNAAGIAVTLMVIGYLFWEFRELVSLTSEVLWVRTLLSVPALGVSAYCFQQASKRHRQFVDARYRALDLVALPPFTDSMEPDEQSRLRMVLGERLFAREEDGAGSQKEGSAEDATFSPTTVQSLTDLLKLLDAVTSKRSG